MTETIIVCDLDGTLCNAEHRNSFAENKQWDEFHARLSDDVPYDDVAFLLRTIHDHAVIILCTGRTEKYRHETYKWLTKHKIPADQLFMRLDGDYRPDQEVKISTVNSYIETNHSYGLDSNVLMVLEDREKMVQAWRDAGFNCWQVRVGGY